MHEDGEQVRDAHMSPEGALSVSLWRCEWRETASTDTCTDRRLEPFLTSPASCSCACVVKEPRVGHAQVRMQRLNLVLGSLVMCHVETS
jgi:hypothetical protein